MHRLTRRLRMLLRVSMFFSAAVALMPSTGAAQIACEGTDVEGATEAYRQGRAALERAVDALRIDDAEGARRAAEEALAAFERQCSLGDATSLERRAMALTILGRPLQSAASLDAFLRSHPLDGLSSEQRARIEANRPRGMLDITGGDPGASLFVDDVEFGSLPRGRLWLPPGTYRLSTRGGADPEDQEVVVSSDAIASVAFRAPQAEPALTEGSAAPVARGGGMVVRRGGSESGSSDVWSALTWGLGVATLVSGAVAIGGWVWADDLSADFSARCPALGPAVCDPILADYQSADALRIGAFVVGGAALTGAAIALVLWLSDSSNSEQGGQVGGLSCALGMTEARCGVEF